MQCRCSHPPLEGEGRTSEPKRSVGEGGRGGVKLTRRSHPTPVAFAPLTLRFGDRPSPSMGGWVLAARHAP